MKRQSNHPGQSGTLVGTRFQPVDLELLDAWRYAQNDVPGRPEAIRRLVRIAAQAKKSSRPGTNVTNCDGNKKGRNVG